MSFNIRYDNPQDGKNDWDSRKDEVAGLIAKYKPDFLGVQEALKNQMFFLDNKLAHYTYTGVGRDDGKEKGEYAAIFFNNSKFDLIETKTYWLSETPNKPSIGWDAAIPRVVTFGTFSSKNTNELFYVLNCHYDHMGKEARTMSSKLIVSLLQELDITSKKIIVMGDFNSKPSGKPIRILRSKLHDAYKDAKQNRKGPKGTFNGFDPTVTPKNRIDYVFTKNLTVLEYTAIEDKRKNRLCVSDHLPVLVKVGEE